jgi:hypothetical protein
LVAGASEVVDEVHEVEADIFAATARPGNGRRWLSMVRCPRKKPKMGNLRCWLGWGVDVAGDWVGEHQGAGVKLAEVEGRRIVTGGELSMWRAKADDGLALWCLLTRQHEDDARSEEVKPDTRRQLWRRLAWWLIDGIAWWGAARCLDEQGIAERVKQIRENS